jgi:hypothetical protein
MAKIHDESLAELESAVAIKEMIKGNGDGDVDGDIWKKISAGTKTLWILVPLIVLFEICMTLPLGIVSPDHPMHIVTYCAPCGINNGALWSTLTKSDERCIQDGILTTLGDSFQGFINNYLATMLGHIFTVYALINAQDASISDKIGIKEKLHFSAYLIIILDIIFELYLLHTIEMSDPDTLSIKEYNKCGNMIVKEITSYKENLEIFAWIVLWIRICIGLTVTIIYVIKSEVVLAEQAEAAEKEE